MDINIVLFHSGKKLPEYLEYTFKQLRLFNPEVIVWFLTNKEHLNNSVFEKYNINTEDLEQYHSDGIEKFEKLYKRKHSDFWNITVIRFFYMTKFLDIKRLENIYHFENDIMVYFSFRKLHSLFKSKYIRIAITAGGKSKVMTGMMYIDGWGDLFLLTNFLNTILSKYGVRGTKVKYGIDMVNEMTLMKIYMEETGHIENLPILPFGEFYNNYKEFNSIFDPASWGQFVGGTTDGIPGAKPMDHYIGQLLIKHPEYTVIWKKDVEDRKIPYFKYEDKEVKINNLHIHSKNLHKYMST